MFKKIKNHKWKLLFSLIVIPITLFLITTVVGILLTIIKTSNFKVQILVWWTNALKIKYFLITALSLSVFLYFYFAYKICKTSKKEAKIKTSNKVDFGQTKWLTTKQLNKNYPLVSENKFTNHHGFVVNTVKKKEVWFNIRSNTHCLVIGGTGSGKTQGLVLPTIKVNACSNIKPSMIITDPKGELYQIQAQMLEKQGYDLKVINLRDANKSMSWNPLQVIYDQSIKMLLTTNEQEKASLRVEVQTNIQDLCKTIFNKKFDNEPFWNDSGALIIEAIILAILEDLENYINENNIIDSEAIIKAISEQLPSNKFNLATVTIIASMHKDMINWFKQRKDTSIAKITANQVLHGESKTLTSILMTISTHLAIFKNDFIRNITSRNDLNLIDLINKPIALFIIVPDENHNYYIFVSLLISQIYKFLIKQASANVTGKLARPIYFLCDEFGNVPPILNMDNIITIARSRNIFFQLIVQDLQQINAKYGKEIANIILANCSLHIFLQTMDLSTAERYSKMIGDTTVLQVSTSGKGKTKTESEALKAHPLIIASDLMKLPEHQAIIFYAKENPAKTKLLPWYQLFANQTNIPNYRSLAFINFQKDYYYDIKTHIKINSKPQILPLELNKLRNSTKKSKQEIEVEIKQLKEKLKNYQHYDSIHHQELKLAIERQIKYLEKQINN